MLMVFHGNSSKNLSQQTSAVALCISSAVTPSWTAVGSWSSPTALLAMSEASSVAACQLRGAYAIASETTEAAPCAIPSAVTMLKPSV
jgi:hypothetical protein